MNKTPFMIVAILFVTRLSIAQEADVTTYSGEKCGYKIDFPADWTVSLTETKVMAGFSAVLIGYTAATPGALVQLRSTYPCKNAESEIKTWISVFEKEAKKSKDPNFKIHGQGEGKTTDGKEFSYIEYTHTRIGDDGAASVVHRKFYITCHRYNKLTYQHAFFFETYEPDWTKYNAAYESIFSSVKYTEKEK